MKLKDEMSSAHALPLSSSPDASAEAGRRRGRAHEAVGSKADDLRLVARLAKREPAAWREFLQKYERLIYSRVLSVYHDLGREPKSDVVEDCCAEVIAALFRGNLKALRQFQGRSRLSTWLAVVTRRVALSVILQKLRDAAQHAQPDSRFDLEAVAAPSKTSLSGELDCNEIVMRLCFTKLSDGDRRVLHCIFDQGMSYDQAAKVLGISTNAVGPKLQRAQQRLKKLIDQHRTQSQRKDQ